jgi:hypothetical protein
MSFNAKEEWQLEYADKELDEAMDVLKHATGLTQTRRAPRDRASLRDQ